MSTQDFLNFENSIDLFLFSILFSFTALLCPKKTLSDAWQGDRPRGIPMVPEELEREAFYNLPGVEEAYAAGDLPLGLDMETVHAVSWKVDKGNLLYLTDKESQMTTFVDQIARVQQKVIVLAPQHHTVPLREDIDLISGEEELVSMIEALDMKIGERLDARQRDHVVTLVLYDWGSLADELDMDLLNRLTFILDKGGRAGYHAIIMSDLSLGRRIDNVSKLLKTYKQAMSTVRFSDQSVLSPINKPLREQPLGDQVHYYVEDNIASKIKVIME